MNKSSLRLVPVLPAIFLLTAPRAHAIFGIGDIVFDPSSYAFQITHEVKELAHFAEEIKKFEDQILNQAKQIQQAKELFDIQNKVRVQIGDWQGVFDRAKAIQLSLRSVTDTTADTKVGNILTLDYGQPGIDRTQSGRTVFLSSSNAFDTRVTLSGPASNRYIAADEAFNNVDRVYKATEQPIADTRRELGETYAAMNEPGLTQADYSKLSGKANGLNSRLDQLDAQRQQASQALTAQQAVNTNQKAKDEEMRREVDRSNHDTFTNAVGAVQYAPFKWR
jgi:predicted  nucleic acid-binding Zn-ribbon protein